MPFSSGPFSFSEQMNSIKVFPFFRPFWTVGKILLSWSDSENLAGSDKNFVFCLSTLFQGYLPFTYRQKLD